MRPALDLRLAPAAVGAWLAAVLVVLGPAGVVRALAVGAGVLALVAVGARRGWSGHAALALAVVTVTLMTGSVQVSARTQGGLAELAEQRRSVVLVGVVRADPRPTVFGGVEGAQRLLVAVESVGPRDVSAGATSSVGAKAEAGAGGGAESTDGVGTVRAAAPVEVVGGPEWAGLTYGTSVRFEGRLSPVPDGRRAVARVQAGPPTVVRGPPSWWRHAAGLRAGLVALAEQVPGDAGGLLPGVAVGDTSRAAPDLTEAMTASGLSHLTAVSGAHFSMVGALVLLGCAAVGVPRRWRAAPAALVMAGFVLLVRPGPSVVRAALMGAVGLAGLVAGRPARAVPALAAAVITLLVVDPWLALDVGFALSVAATAGIALLAGPLAARWADRIGRGPALALAVPIAAQAACGPVLVLLDPSVAMYAVPANLVAAPAVGPATVLGLLAALVAPVWPPAAAALAHLAGAACWWIARVARIADGLPGAHLPWVGGLTGVLLLAGATGAAVLLVLRCRRDMAR